MQDVRLQEIVVGGFEVFDELTRIPIRPLTLLYGPNSAGKSSLEEVVVLLRDICGLEGNIAAWKQTPFDTTVPMRGERLLRSWRRVSDAPLVRAPKLTLGATLEVSAINASYTNDRLVEFQDSTWQNERHLLSLVVEFETADDEAFGMFHALHGSADRIGKVNRNLELAVNDAPLLFFRDKEAIGINYGHSVWRGDGIPREIKLALGDSEHFLQVDGEWAWFNGDVELTADKSVFVEGLSVSLNVNAPQRVAVIRAVQQLFEDFNLVLPRACSNVYAAMDGQLVPASRQIPSTEDLSFLIQKSVLGEDHTGFHFRLGGDERYRSLARSFVYDLKPWAASSPVPTASYAATVNRMLTDHLFTDRGYHLDMDYRVVLRPDEFEALADDGFSSSSPTDYSIAVKLGLKDAQGRHYSFAEVCSGLGYVLPVLCAVSESRGLTLLQQPELHLHPALQAALGDVLIESSRHHSAMFVETHSEHLLLRILKRIRQASSQRISAEQSLDADDLAVLYFEPHPDGTTSVKRLRVSDTGEFVDRWPRGFFAERDQELWDE